MTYPNVYICGDSFSAVNDSVTCNHPLDDVEAYSWVHELQKRYSVTCYARSGASNFDIINQIKRLKTYDLLITNLTQIKRLALHVRMENLPNVDLLTVARRNIELGKWISKRPNSICWTPFTGYEAIKTIHTMYFERENEYFNKQLSAPVTKHHMTEKGNQLLAEWMIDQIERKLHERH